MFFNVLSLTLLLLMVQKTYQGELISKSILMHPSYQSNNYIEYNEPRRGLHDNDYIKHQIGNYQKSHRKSQFVNVMNYIMRTPDYGLKFTEAHSPRILEYPSFPGFHSLIEVRGPERYRYIPKNKKKKKKPYKDFEEINELQHKAHISMKQQDYNQLDQTPHKLSHRKFSQLNDADFSKEEFAIWDESQESYKRSASVEVTKRAFFKRNKKRSTPKPNFYRYHHFTTTPNYRTVLEVPLAGVIKLSQLVEVVTTSNSPYVMPLGLPDINPEVDPLPFKQVKPKGPDSDEDDGYEIAIEYD